MPPNDDKKTRLRFSGGRARLGRAVRGHLDRLRDREIVVKLFDELGPRFANRNGGYLRILKYGFRQGDNAPMALVELVERPEVEAAAE